MMNCHECRNQISELALSCPRCGAPRLTEPSKTFSTPTCPACKINVNLELEELTTCPNCHYSPAAMRVAPPTKKKLSAIHWIGIFVFGPMFAILIFGNTSKGTPKSQEPQSAASCRDSLQCWSGKNELAAQMKCKDAVAAQAKFRVNWLSMLVMHESQWADKSAGTMTYFGDELEIQNQFGAYERTTFACTFDPSTKEVVGLRLTPGQLH